MINKIRFCAITVIFSSLFLFGCDGGESSSAADPDKAEPTQTTSQKTDVQANTVDDSLLAFGAIVMPNEYIDQLNMGKAYDEDNVKSVLAKNWAVTDTETAKKQLDWLVKDGHRSDPNIMLLLDEGIDEEADVIAYRRAMIDSLAFAAEDARNFKNIDAWDIERIALIARYSYLAGFLTEQETIKYLEIAKKMAQDRYGSWSEYVVSFLTGRALSFGNTPVNLIGNIKLLMGDQDSIWNKNVKIWKN